MIANDSLDSLFRDVEAHAAQPLWTQMSTMVPPRPQPRAVPHVWRWSEMRPLLARAGQLIDAREAERRVLMLVNPALRPPFTTDTLYAGLQLILPGEVAPAHRHVAFALRFIVEGDAAFTAVGGERVTMRRGDLVLTPSWEFHDHGHEGDGPMVWLDGLDLPVWQFAPANFAEAYEHERYPSSPVDITHLRYPWEPVRGALDAAPGPFATYEYSHARDGGAISRTIGAGAERIAGGATTPARRETAGIVFHVVEGRGTTSAGSTTIDWEQGDTFCVPAWQTYRHTPASDAYLFRFDDAPLLRALGAYRRDDG